MKCDKMTVDELHHEWNNYTRHVAGGATSTTLSVGFAPITMGASLIGVGLSAPRIHNARKKRAIIEAHLQARGTTHHTRKRDVAGPMALSTAIGGLTLGLAPAGADVVGAHAAEQGFHTIAGNPEMLKIGAHMALDGAGTAVEHKHDKKHHENALQKLRDSVAMKEKNTHLQPHNGHQQYATQQGTVSPTGYSPHPGVMQQGSSGIPSFAPPPGNFAPAGAISQGPNCNVYLPPPGYSSPPATIPQGPNGSSLPPAPGYLPSPAGISQDPNGYAFPPPPSYSSPAGMPQGPNGFSFPPPPAYPPTVVMSRAPNDTPSSLASEKYAIVSYQPPSPGYFPHPAGVQQGPSIEFSPPPGHSPHPSSILQAPNDITQPLEREQNPSFAYQPPSSSDSSYQPGMPPESSYSPYSPSSPPQTTSFTYQSLSSGYSSFSAGTPQGSNGNSLAVAPHQNESFDYQSPSPGHFTYSAGTPQGPDYSPYSAGTPQWPNNNSLPMTPHQNTNPTYQPPHQVGGLAPPAYDVREISDDEDDVNIKEIEALLKQLKASKAAKRKC